MPWEKVSSGATGELFRIVCLSSGCENCLDGVCSLCPRISTETGLCLSSSGPEVYICSKNWEWWRKPYPNGASVRLAEPLYDGLGMLWDKGTVLTIVSEESHGYTVENKAGTKMEGVPHHSIAPAQ